MDPLALFRLLRQNFIFCRASGRHAVSEARGSCRTTEDLQAAEEVAAEQAPDEAAPAAEAPEEAPALAEEAADAAAEVAATEPAEPELEVFYTFTWGRQRPSNQGQRGNRREARGGGEGKPQGRKGGGKPRRDRDGGKPPRGKGGPRDRDQQKGAKTYSSRPPRQEKKIDPDNPFAAALMGLRDDKSDS